MRSYATRPHACSSVEAILMRAIRYKSTEMPSLLTFSSRTAGLAVVALKSERSIPHLRYLAGDPCTLLIHPHARLLDYEVPKV